MINIDAFHQSIWKELDVVCDRVRNLIHHRWEDGKYKESILKSVISKFLPERYGIWSWFIVAKSRKHSSIYNHSSQIDLIVYDKSIPTLFSEWDFVIVTPRAVRAIIEVKANIQKQELKKIMDKSNKIWKFILENRWSSGALFNWIFSYSGYSRNPNYSLLTSKIREITNEHISQLWENDIPWSFYLVNHLRINSNLFAKYRKDQEIWCYSDTRSLYNLKKLSTTFFISNLINYLDQNFMLDSALRYPTDKEKEKICDF